MKLSCFCRIISYQDKILLKNFQNGAMASVPKNIYDKIISSDFLEIEKDRSSIELEEDLSNLEKLKFFTSQTHEEEFSFFQKELERGYKKSLGILLATTTYCNLHCPYCYEEKVESTRMKPDLYPPLIQWFTKNLQLREKEINSVFLTLYGGEPLLDFAGLHYLIPKLYNICDQLGMKFKLGMITNGVLLTAEKVDFFKKYNFSDLQVTFDGPPLIHDQLRKDKHNRGTFWAIIKNLKYLVDNLSILINVRVNFESKYYKKIPELLKILKNRGLDSKISLSFAPLENIFSKTKVRRKESRCIFPSFPEQIEIYYWLLNRAEQMEFKVNDEFSLGPCMTSNPNAFVIDPDGFLYKCMEMIGNRKLAIGHIENENLDYKIAGPNLEKCIQNKCMYFPICFGGCRSFAYRQNGNISALDCRKSFLDNMTQKLILRIAKSHL